MLKQVCTEVIRKCRCLPVIWTLFLLIVGLPFSVWVLAASMPVSLKSIDIVYYIDFPWHKTYETETVKGCHRFFLHSGSAVLRCREGISLLRPLYIIKAWQIQQSKVGFFSLTINEFGIKNVHGYIKKIKSTSFDTFPVHGQKPKIMTVTGKFIRHVNNVRKYQFRNRATGRISSVFSTPNHPFYVKSRGSFIPIEAISVEDEMVQRDGQVVKLIYTTSHGTAGRVKPEKSIVPVYNLEIAQKHTYFVGKDFLLVHNAYTGEKTKHIRLNIKDRYNVLLRHNLIKEVKIRGPGKTSHTTLEFRLKAKDRAEFLSKHSMSAGKNEEHQIATAITEPLKKIGFVSVRKGLRRRNVKSDLVWRLTNWKKFRFHIGDTTGLESPSLPPPPDSLSELPSSSAPGPSHFDVPSLVPFDPGEPPSFSQLDVPPSVPLYSGEPPVLSHFGPYPGGSPPFSLPSDGYYQPPPSAPCFFPDF